MKRIISLMVLLFSITLFSQSKKVKFDYEVMYLYQRVPASFYISKEYPEVILRNSLLVSNFLYYDKYNKKNTFFYALNENNEIDYEKLKLSPEHTEKILEIIKGEKKEIINGFECEKFTVISERDGDFYGHGFNITTYEFFITNHPEINNIEFIYRILGNEAIPIFNSGLIVKINKYFEEFRTVLELIRYKETDKSILIDFEKLNLELLQNYSIDIETEK